MTMGLRIPTPEHLQWWSRKMDAWRAAYEAAKTAGEVRTCRCQQCIARTRIAIDKRLPAEFRE